MKKILFLLIAVFFVTCIFAHPKKKKKTHAIAAAAPQPATEATPVDKAGPLSFKDETHDFGKIKHAVPVSYFFEFKNISANPVIIENAVAGCGCTTPEFPKEAINKGKSNKIKVTFNALTIGSFVKNVTVTLAKGTAPIILTIKGEVLPDEAPKTN